MRSLLTAHGRGAAVAEFHGEGYAGVDDVMDMDQEDVAELAF
jgi:hypothetical protein